MSGAGACRDVWSATAPLTGRACMSSASSPDPSSEVVIRPIRAEDAEGANQLRLLPSSVEFTLAFPSLRLEQTRRWIESMSPDDHVFVAVLDGQIVGQAGL